MAGRREAWNAKEGRESNSAPAGAGAAVSLASAVATRFGQGPVLNASLLHAAEAWRLELLRELELAALQSVPELDAIVRLAATVTQVPIATLCVVEQTQLHFVARLATL